MSLKSDQIPTFKELEEYTQKRCFALSNITSTVRDHVTEKVHNIKINANHSNNSKNKTCTICRASNHASFKCPDLLKLNPKERFTLIKSKCLCIKCFGVNHTVT